MFRSKSKEAPWITEGKKVWGFHEVNNRTELKKWLRSDGLTLGDPSKLPWCGDFVETAIKNTLPDEPFPDPLGRNPYWARNWLHFGKAVNPSLYCVMVFERGSGGHVGFAIGQDDNTFLIFGGNQSNSVSITRITKNRLLGARWPVSYHGTMSNLPYIKNKKIPISVNEF